VHKKRISAVLFLLFATCSFAAPDDEQEIRNLTDQFCKAIVARNIDAIDGVFDPDPSNIYYDINEGPLVGLDRLKQVWRAAVTNQTISRFEFGRDMKVTVRGTEALQTGSWEQSIQRGGSQRNIVGRATILWHKTSSGWRVYHYHASITPRG
jgi:ketosteroid isomerase-like protein